MGDRGRFGREHRQHRPLWGGDLRFGALLAIGLAAKFAPPMLSAKIDGPPASAVASASTSDPNRPPTDALTNTLPSSVNAASATSDEPPVLAAPVFELEEKKPPKLESKPTLPEPPKPEPPKSEPTFDPLDPPKPPTKIDVASKKGDEAPPKPVKLRPPESIREEAPIFLADAPKKDPPAKEPAPKSSEAKGPIHPYFQRYLDQKEYYARPGDTLELIAHRLYQDETKAPELLAANKSALPTADALKPGMTIKLP